MVQHNAAKFVTNKYPRKGHYEDFSISDIITELQWESLEERRIKAKLTSAYKILNGHWILPPDCLPKDSNTRKTRLCNEVLVGPKHKLLEPDSRLSTTANTFFFCVPHLWNTRVQPAQADATSIENFRNYFNT